MEAPGRFSLQKEKWGLPQSHGAKEMRDSTLRWKWLKKIPASRGMTFSEARNSFVFPDGFAFFQEGGEAFLEIGRAADAGIFEDGAFEVRVYASLFGGNEQAFGAAEAAGADFDQIVGKFVGASHQFVGGDNFADQPQLMCFPGVDFAAGEQKVAGALVADLASEKHGNDCREKANADFGVAEARLGNGESEIAKRGDATTAGERMAIDGRDQRAREAPDAPKEFGDTAGVFLVFLGRLFADGLEHVQIHAGAECGAGAGKDDDAHPLFFDFIESGLQLGNHLRIDGVALLGT